MAAAAVAKSAELPLAGEKADFDEDADDVFGAVETRKWEPAGKAVDLELKSIGGMSCIAISGDLIFSGSARAALQVHQVAEGKITEVRKFKSGALGCGCVQVAEESDNLLASCHEDGVIGLWDVRTSKRICGLESTISTACKVRFMPGASSFKLVSGGTSGAIAFWDLRTYKMDEEIGPETSASAVAKKADPFEVAVKRQRRGGSEASASSPVYSLAISGDGRLLGAGRGSGDLAVMRLETRQWCGGVSAHRGEKPTPVRGVVFDASSKLLLSGGDDNHLCMLDAASWARRPVAGESRWPMVERLPAHRGWVSSVSVCPDPKQHVVVTTSWDKTVKLWDHRSNKMLRSYTEHSDAVTCSAFAAVDGGRFFATAGADAQLVVYVAKDS